VVAGLSHAIELLLEQGRPVPQFRVFACEVFLGNVLRLAETPRALSVPPIVDNAMYFDSSFIIASPF
jgi:hypothetical protein